MAKQPLQQPDIWLYMVLKVMSPQLIQKYMTLHLLLRMEKMVKETDLDNHNIIHFKTKQTIPCKFKITHCNAANINFNNTNTRFFYPGHYYLKKVIIDPTEKM